MLNKPRSEKEIKRWERIQERKRSQTRDYLSVEERAIENKFRFFFDRSDELITGFWINERQCKGVVYLNDIEIGTTNMSLENTYFIDKQKGSSRYVIYNITQDELLDVDRKQVCRFLAEEWVKNKMYRASRAYTREKYTETEAAYLKKIKELKTVDRMREWI